MPKRQEAIYQPIYDGVDALKANCLLKSDSLFTPGQAVWTLANIEELHRRFNQSPDESSNSFMDKLTKQLSGADDHVIQLMGEILWVHFCCAFDVRGSKKREHINTVLNWASAPAAIPKALALALDNGMASTGVAFNTYRPQQIWYLIDMLLSWKQGSSEQQNQWLQDPWAFKDMAYSVPIEKAYIQRNALLHLIHPDTFEDIYSRDYKQKIVKHFRPHLNPEESDEDKLLAQAREYVRKTVAPLPHEAHGNPFWWSGVLERWNPPKEKAESQSSKQRKAWVYAPGTGAFAWQKQLDDGVMGVGFHEVGDLSRFSSKEEVDQVTLSAFHTGKSKPIAIMKAMRDLRFEIQPGDIAFAKNGRSKLIGMGVVTSGYRHDLTVPGFPHRIKVDWKLTGEWVVSKKLPLKTLTQVKDMAAVEDWLAAMGTSLAELQAEENTAVSAVNDTGQAPYPFTALAGDTHMAPALLQRICTAAAYGPDRNQFGQIILYGPPGTGKTFIAEKVAKHLVEGDESRIHFAQFHPAYAYEHFIEGHTPKEKDGQMIFELQKGLLRKVVDAIERSETRHVLVVDEMNRGDMAHIFGELMYLLSRRGEHVSVTLPKSGEQLSLPDNLSIIGTMNTADRSIARVDFALRRRFRFFHIAPMPEILPKVAKEASLDFAKALQAQVERSNQTLAEEQGGLRLGHSYFMGLGDVDELEAVWQQEIYPLLEDYLDYDTARLKEFEWPAVEGFINAQLYPEPDPSDLLDDEGAAEEDVEEGMESDES